jgi:hypothetical protein
VEIENRHCGMLLLRSVFSPSHTARLLSAGFADKEDGICLPPPSSPQILLVLLNLRENYKLENCFFFFLCLAENK